MTYKEFEEKAASGLEKAYDEVIKLAIDKDPDIKPINSSIRDQLLSAVVPLNTIGLLGKILFEKLNISDEELNKLLDENYNDYKTNLIASFKEDDLI